jgi:hypothetical protein
VIEAFGFPRHQMHRADLLATASTDWSIDAVAWIYGHDAGIVGDTAV